MVDMFASINQSRLLWFRLNQPTIWACLYSGLEDAAAQGDDEVDLHTLGQRFILPSSYIGGPHHMQQCFQDSMAIMRYFGQVDIFMMVTTNLLWPEIMWELLPGQTAYDRPDLVSWVFQMKKKAIIDFIYKHGIFGSTVAYVCVHHQISEMRATAYTHSHFFEGTLQAPHDRGNWLMHLGMMARSQNPATVVQNDQEVYGSWAMQGHEP